MTSEIRSYDARTLLGATREALTGSVQGLDGTAIAPETPLATLLFDSLVAVNFIATLEAILQVEDLPFERWLAEHSERADALTIGSLVDWLRTLPQLGGVPVGRPEAGGRPGIG
jgi:hypothetical protein